jgi:hypothetical protein
MPSSYIDNNDKPVLLAWNETTGKPEPIRVDPIFGYVEIYVVAMATPTGTTLDYAKIDGNDNATLLGWNDTTNDIEALRCDSLGNLIITS